MQVDCVLDYMEKLVKINLPKRGFSININVFSINFQNQLKNFGQYVYHMWMTRINEDQFLGSNSSVAIRPIARIEFDEKLLRLTDTQHEVQFTQRL